MKRLHLIGFLSVGILLLVSSCKKDIIATDSLYVPSASDVTATATLAQLQSGRSIFVNKCGACHGLYSPDSYSSSNWKSILSSMAPRAGLSASDATLVYMYVSRGK